MRKLLLFSILLFCFATLTNAQVISKGQKIIGGSISASSRKEDFNNNHPFMDNYFNLSTNYGKAFKNNTVVGISINYLGQKNENFYSPIMQITKTNSIGAGIFIEKFFPLVKSLSISTNAGIYGGRNFTEENRLIEDSLTLKAVRKGNYGAISLTSSLNYQFSKRLIGQLNMYNMVSYSYSKGNTTTDYPIGSSSKGKYSSQYFYSSFNNGIRLSDISVSFRYLLN